MDNAIYATLTRQGGLMNEMRAIANNIANANTTGFRREGVIFAEHLAPTGPRIWDGLSMATARGRVVDLGQGGLTQTNGTFDLGINGPGFFAIQTPQGTQLTRAGAFLLSPEGEVINADGNLLLDAGLAPIAVPPGAKVAIGRDGTVSADGQPVGQVGLFAPPPPETMKHQGGTGFAVDDIPEPDETSQIMQGFLEDSNVDPVTEMTRMIEVQRAYELGQSFLNREDERIRAVIVAMTR